MGIEVEGSRAVSENDWFYDLVVPEQQAEPETEPEPESVIEPAVEAVVEPEPEAEPEVQPEPEVETVIPEYKGKKYIPLENEKEIYETLAKKYRYENMRPEEKAIAFIAKENPGLSDDEIMFIASTEFGIGVEKPDETDLTDAQMLELKKQDIARKKLFHQADNFYKEEAGKITLDGIDPLEEHEDFKAYRQSQVEAAKIKAQQEQNYQNTIKEVQNAVKTISELNVPAEVDIDDRKFAVDVKFKMDAKKQEALIDYSKRYSPSQDEIAEFTDANTGKFDWKGYHTELANRLFYKDIVKAGLRQGLSQDREQFIEKELKNSTLRNNDVSQTREVAVDANDAYWSRAYNQ